MTEKLEKVDRYLNPVALLHLNEKATYKVLLAGRGFSKSFLNGCESADRVRLMPKSCGLFLSPTYAMIYTKTLIPMMAAWQQHFNYIEGIHYVVGKSPPKYFKRPWHKPGKYENVVTFWNGTTIIFGSFDRPASISGGSYDWAICDEAYLIDKEDYDNYVIPTMRGTHTSFKGLPNYLQHSFTSSMPFRGNGDWLMDFYAKAKQCPYIEEKKDDEKYISYSFLGWDPDPNIKLQLGSTWMNYEVLGKKAINAMKAEMDQNSYRVMILNEKVTNWGNLFYPVLSKKHWYTPMANDKAISLSLQNARAVKRDATFDIGEDDYDPDRPINLSHDWGTFNCITIDQEYPKEVRVINTMHVLNPEIITDLADDFCEYYKDHRAKLVYQWGDRAGTNKQANAKKNYFDEFADQLREKGWRVVRKATGHVEHMDRFLFINKLHSEEDPSLPRIRYNSKCTDFKIAMESAGMKDNKKDKSSESNASIKPQHATHYTDAHDYRMYHGFINKQKGQSSLSSSSSL
jgi:hypothetical protein